MPVSGPSMTTSWRGPVFTFGAFSGLEASGAGVRARGTRRDEGSRVARRTQVAAQHDDRDDDQEPDQGEEAQPDEGEQELGHPAVTPP